MSATKAASKDAFEAECNTIQAGDRVMLVSGGPIGLVEGPGCCAESVYVRWKNGVMLMACGALKRPSANNLTTTG